MPERKRLSSGSEKSGEFGARQSLWAVSHPTPLWRGLLQAVAESRRPAGSQFCSRMGRRDASASGTWSAGNPTRRCPRCLHPLGVGFDLDILAEESGLLEHCRDLAVSHVDMMFHILCRLGYGVGLDAAARGMELDPSDRFSGSCFSRWQYASAEKGRSAKSGSRRAFSEKEPLLARCSMSQWGLVGLAGCQEPHGCAAQCGGQMNHGMRPLAVGVLVGLPSPFGPRHVHERVRPRTITGRDHRDRSANRHSKRRRRLWTSA